MFRLSLFRACLGDNSIDAKAIFKEIDKDNSKSVRRVPTNSASVTVCLAFLQRLTLDP